MKFSKRAKRDILFTFFILSTCFLLYQFLFGKTGYFAVDQHKEMFYQLQEENLVLRKQNEQLKHSIDKLKKDPSAVERIGIEEHDLARPGDIIIHLPKPESKEPSPPAPERLRDRVPPTP